MNVITGIFPPTSGSAIVNGYSVLNQLKQARRSLALCPQHNVLYNDLTVEEHLLFFAGLKGLTFKESRIQIDECLSLLMLENKRNELASTLSGGMKRKLSLGIAMIGGSEVLILDEPTSGMDPQARRAIWDLLTHIKHNRTIVLTTHYMEEADILGDRIAIMAEGVVQCCGSPLFLKRKFGAGYHLRVSKGEYFKEQALRDVVQNSVPSAYLDNEMNTEVSYVLPVNDAQPFLSMFEDLEKKKEQIGYTACGLTITTMEDVFLKVGQLADTSKEETKDNMLNMMNSSHSTSDFGTFEQSDGPSFQVLRHSRHTGSRLWWSQVRGLLTKRLHDSRRYIFFLVFLVILPFLILTSMLTTKNQINKFVADSSLDELQVDLGKVYGATTSYYGNETDEVVNHFASALRNAQATPVQVYDPLAEVLNISEKDFTKYKQKLLVGGGFVSTAGQLNLTAMYNEEAYHTSTMALNLMNVALLRSVTGDDSATISLTNAPLKNTEDKRKTTEASAKANNFLLGAFMPLAMSFLSASFVLFPVHERSTKSKLIQLMTGVDGLTFWSAHFVWDFSMHILASCFVLIPFVFLDQVGAYAVGSGALGTLFLLLILFGWSSIPLSYLFSFVAKKPSVGFTIATAFNFITGMLMTVALSMTDVILKAMGKDTSWIEPVVWICRFLPNFSMAWGTTHMDAIANGNVLCDQMYKENRDLMNYVCQSPYPSPLQQCCSPDICGRFCFKKRSMLGMDADQCGRELLFMFLSGCIFFAALAILESNAIRFWYRLRDRKGMTPEMVSVPYLERQTSGIGEDSDVAAERSRVEYLFEQGRTSEEAIVAHNLTKHFGSLNAVDHLTFAVHRDECFGLLGVNGAGKTTTFSMLTGDLAIGDGTAMIGHYSVRDDLKMFQRQVGYCPQFDALLDRLTGREALYLFARLRGLHESDIPSVVSSLINVVDLQKHADKTADKYSGGNRRKLSLALSLIGSPPMVFLDEPTAGVDPASRRKIWSALVQVQQAGGTSLILTTHSMEECEALCGRLVIMVNGQFRCLGPIQYLKSKFGQGHTIIVKLNKEQHLDQQATLSVQNFFQNTFPGCVLKDVHQGMLHYHIVDTTITWSRLFREMEQAKATFNLEDYLISDTTLEQIFLAFAKTQRVSAET